ncbi:MAG: C40 family peptidase [Clostridia bacterium]|nr:C40 family peptidase [Clostridia bacterium]
MKNITKKFLAMVLALSFSTGLYACGNNSTSDAPNPPDSPEASTPVDPDNGSNGETATPEAPPVQVTKKTQDYIRCTSNSVNIRSGAGTDYAVLGSAGKGEVYAVVGKTGNWYKTTYKNKTAYIYAEYAAVFSLEKSSNDKVEDVLEEGYSLLGTPYVYGAVRLHDGKGKLLQGFTAQKFDCSSLVQYVFYHGAGKLLNTTTRTQVTQGTYVHPSDLKRGDCIYFTNAERYYKTGVERIGHVAIYLGNNYILHTASDYARIETISTQRWNYYIEARRFV